MAWANSRPMKAIYRLLGCCTLAVLAALCWPAAPVDGRAGPATLPAGRVLQAPVIDGALSEPAWDAATAVTVPVRQPVSSSGIGDVEAELRAAHDGRFLYLAASWPDPTESVLKSRWLRRDGQWVSDADQDEDRLALMFSSGTVTGFAERGCQALCHGGVMRTVVPRERVDVWHWKAARTNPMGYADDEWWDDTTQDVAESGGRKPDASAPGRAGPQTNKAGAGPAFTFAPGVAPGHFLRPADAVPYQPEQELDSLPGYLLRRARGSRADVMAVAQWLDGRWTVELRRRLSTGHDDDVVFEPGHGYLFSLALFENLTEALGHGRHGQANGPYQLLLQP